MLFSSTTFLVLFLTGTLLVYYMIPRAWRWGRNLLLLAVSLVFYWWGEPKFVAVMVASIGMNYLFGLWVHWCKQSGRSVRPAVVCTVIANLSILFVFKYLNFTLRNLKLLGLPVEVTEIVLPIGISFFTFQAMSYVFDIALGAGRVQKNPLNVGLYVALFPQLVAGPIVKYETVADEIMNRRENWPDFSEGVRRFLIGVAKKVLLSNQMAVVADAAFGADAPSAAFAWLGSVCYTLQLYYDFSGYSDMAIGLGRMFGFHFLENFNYPHISRSFSEFWRRWHISLASWFRDYVYYPLGGSRVGKAKQIRNMFVVWLLTGVWHGANWTYVGWGLSCFVLLAAEKYLGLGKNLPRFWQHVYALLCINLTNMLFRSESLTHAWSFLRAMLGENGWFCVYADFYFFECLVFLVFAILFAMPVAKWMEEKMARSPVPILTDTLYAAAVLGVFLVAVAYLVKGTYNPFIYFNF